MVGFGDGSEADEWVCAPGGSPGFGVHAGIAHRERGRASMDGDQFFTGLLAAIRLVAKSPTSMDQYGRLTSDKAVLNRAFRAATECPAGKFFDLKRIGVDCDPLYGVSPWFERAMTRARRDLLRGFDSPHDEAVIVRLRREQAEGILAKIGYRDKFTEMAEAFMGPIEPKPIQPGDHVLLFGKQQAIITPGLPYTAIDAESANLDFGGDIHVVKRALYLSHDEIRELESLCDQADTAKLGFDARAVLRNVISRTRGLA